MALTVTSSQLNDAQFLTAVRGCTLPAAWFRHGDHLRLAWLLLHRFWSPALLNSEAARLNWVAPDRTTRANFRG